MKLVFSKQVYDQLDDENRAELTPVPCSCVTDGNADLECDSCNGGGLVYEDTTLSAEQSAAIEDNLRKQGVPLGKADN